MESLEEVLLFVFGVLVVSVILVYGIYWGNSVSESYQLSSLKNQFQTGIKIYAYPNSIVITNSQQPILINAKLKELYANQSSISTAFANYSNLRLSTGSTTINFPMPNPIYYSISFYEPATQNYVYTSSGYVSQYYLYIPNLYSGTEIYINGQLEHLPTSVKFAYIPLTSSTNNITLISRYFYINKIIYTQPNENIYTITLPENFTKQNLNVYGFNGTSIYPLPNATVNINNLLTLVTNSSGKVTFPYSGNSVLLKIHYTTIQKPNYTNYSGVYKLPQTTPIILDKVVKLITSILLYYNYTFNEYVQVPGTVFLTSKLKNYSIYVSPNSTSSFVISNIYNATVVTTANKTYGYYTKIPILENNQSVCFRLLLNGSFINNYTCPPPPQLSPLELIFDEKGLPTNTLWNVTLDSTLKNSTSNQIIFKVARFKLYNFSVGSPIPITKNSRYEAFPSTGKASSNYTNTTVMINFVKQYYLTMSANEPTYGNVIPNSGWYNSSSVITINAIPAQYYHFVSWTGIGNGSYSGTNSIATIIMNGPINETANFQPNEYIVYFNETGLPTNTLWTAVLNASSKSSSTNSINFTAIHGTYPFDINNVSINSTIKYVPNVTSGTLTVNSNTVQNVKFYPWYYLTMLTNTTRGSVSPQSGWYKQGSTVTISATANPGYEFIGWNGIGKGNYTGINATANIIINNPITETANFKPLNITIYFNSTPVNSIKFSLNGVYNYTNHTFTNIVVGNTYTYAFPKTVPINSSAEYSFNSIDFCGKILSANQSSFTADITMNDCKITAQYVKEYLLTLTAYNGTISTNVCGDSANCWVPVGTNVTLTGTPNSNYEFKNYTGVGASSYTGTSNPVTITMNSPVGETAYFVPTFISTFILIPITLRNSQNVPTPSPFQQMINLTESSISKLQYNGTFADFEYVYQNGTTIPAWIETNDSGKLITWAKLNGGIPASSSITIYLKVEAGTNFLSNSGTYGIGEAPQLSPIYAEYDDGANVFNFYDNFAGNTLNTTKWSSSVSAGTLSVNNGITLSGTSPVAWLYGKIFTPTAIIDADASSAVGYPEVRVGFSLTSGDATNYDQLNELGEGGGGDTGYYIESSLGGFRVTSSSSTITPPLIMTFVWSATGLQVAFINYGSEIIGTNTLYSWSPTSYPSIMLGYVPLGSSVSVPWETIQWVRTRAYPPNGVMPSVSFGTVTAPTGIVTYVPIIITNSQTTTTPAPFQQMINITESSFSNYITYNGNIANFEYFYANGTVIPAWIESNQSGTLITWVKLASGISANSSTIIYLGFASKTTNLLSSSGTTGIGEAPELSSTYAQYDDGASVFNNYWNFAGTTCPSGWTCSGVIVNNGVTVSSSSPSYANTNSLFGLNSEQILDTFGNIQSPVDNGGAGVGFGSGTNLFRSLYNFVVFYDSVAQPDEAMTDISTGFTGVENNVANYPTGLLVRSIYWTSSLVNFYSSYNLIGSTTSDIPNVALPIDYADYLISGANLGTFYWFRIRAYPPNGVMPSVSIS